MPRRRKKRGSKIKLEKNSSTYNDNLDNKEYFNTTVFTNIIKKKDKYDIKQEFIEEKAIEDTISKSFEEFEIEQNGLLEESIIKINHLEINEKKSSENDYESRLDVLQLLLKESNDCETKKLIKDEINSLKSQKSDESYIYETDSSSENLDV